MRFWDEEDWQSWVSSEQPAIVAYAQRWAELMELEIDQGAVVHDIAERTRHEANTERLSLAELDAAIGMLVDSWLHGFELRAWDDSQG